MVPSPKLLTRAVLPLFASLALTSISSAATYDKANNTTDLDQAGSWATGIVPGSLDIANWTAAAGNDSTASLNADLTWGTVQIKDAIGTVTINGPGTLTLAGTGTNYLGINANSGTTANLTINSNLITASATQEWTVASGRTLTLGGTVTATDTAITLGVGGGNINVTGSLNTTKQLWKKGAGTLTLSGSNNITGQFLLTEGIVELSSSDSLKGGISVNDGGASKVAQVQLTNNFDFTPGISANNAHVNAQTTGAHVVNVNGNHTINNVSIGTAAGSYGVRSDSGTLSVANLLGNALASNTKDNARTIEVGGNGDIVVRGGITDGTLPTVGGKIITVNKFGTGTLSLEGASTYEGVTTVEGGTLLVNGSVASSLVTVRSGATLGGKGTVKAVSIESGGTVTVGNVNTIAILKSGDFTLAGTFAAKLGKASARDGLQAVAGTDYDQVNVTGAITLDGADLKLTLQTGIQTDDLYFIIKNSGTNSVTGIFATLNGSEADLSQDSFLTVGGQRFQISYTANYANNTFDGGNDIALLAVVPEPGTWGMILAGLGVIIVLSRAQRTMKVC